jgi:hypothetical protein
MICSNSRAKVRAVTALLVGTCCLGRVCAQGVPAEAYRPPSPQPVAQPAALAMPRADSPTSVLLLNNGEVLEGQITRVGDRYHVVLPSGEIRVKAGDVHLQCANVEEIYRHKRAVMHLGRAEEHLELAAWCHRYGLLDQAARELADATAADPRHPRIALIRRRIELALHPPEPSTGPVVPVSRPVPSHVDLDRLVRDMPPGTVETFARTIQPLLVHSCASAECHGPRSDNPLRLLRIPLGQPPSRRLTQRNLYNTLQCLDHERPDASPLLTVPIHPHATAKEAVFTGRQLEQYRQLVQWVRQVAARDIGAGTPAPDPGEPQPLEHLPTMPVPLATQGTAQPAPGGSRLGQAQTAPARSVFDRALPDRRDPLRPGPGVQRGAKLPLYRPVDPFDPEVFNRQFLPAASPAPQGPKGFPADFSAPPDAVTAPDLSPPAAGPPETDDYSPEDRQGGPFPRPPANGPTRPRPDWGEGYGSTPAGTATKPDAPSRG